MNQPDPASNLRVFKFSDRWKLSVQVMAEFFSQLPSDAVVADIRREDYQMAWIFFISSGEFSKVPEGETVPPGTVRLLKIPGENEEFGIRVEVEWV